MATTDELRNERESHEVMLAALKEAPRLNHRKPLKPAPVVGFEVIVIAIRCIAWLSFGVALLWGILE